MKRYIKSQDIININDDGDDVTMNFDNKIDVMKWLDIAEPRIRKFLNTLKTNTTFYEVDDIAWGKDCFQIPIFKCDYRTPGKMLEFDKFKFCYDPDDVFDRTALEQLNDKLDEFIDDFSYRV